MMKSIFNCTVKQITATIIILTIVSFIPCFSESQVQKLTFNSSGQYFKLNPVTDSVLLGSGLAITGTAILMDKVVQPKNSTWDGALLNRDTVSGFDRAFMNPYSKPMNTAATILEAAALLTPAVLMASPINEWCTIGTMYAESVILSYGLKELGKSLVNRPRPFMYFDDFPQEDVENGDWNSSFPSGHTTMSFTAAAFATFTFCKYFPDSPWRIPVIAGSYAIAGTVAVLRLTGGKHFLSDVLTGAAIGTASGLLIPWLHTLGTTSSNGSSQNTSGSRNSNDGVSALGYSNNTSTNGFSFAIIPNGIYCRIGL